MGHPREIQEVLNAFATYQAMDDWDVSAENDLLAAHELLMRGLVDETAWYRSGGVGYLPWRATGAHGTLADRVPKLMGGSA